MGSSSRIINLSLSSTTTTARFSSLITFPKFHPPCTVYQRFKTLSTTTAAAAAAITTDEPSLESSKHSILLERLRIRHLKDSVGNGYKSNEKKKQSFESEIEDGSLKVLGFSELGLSEEVLAALVEMGIKLPTEIQCLGIPAVLDEKSVVLGSHTGSGKTLAYLLPLVQVFISLFFFFI